MRIPKGAIKKNALRVGMTVMYGRSGSLMEGVVTKIDCEGASIGEWACTVKRNGYWGANYTVGYLRKVTKKGTIKFADATGFETDKYEPEHDAPREGRRSEGVKLKVKRGIIEKLCSSAKSIDNSDAYLIGGRQKVVDTIVKLNVSGGCEDSPKVEAEDVANGLNILVAVGARSYGFIIVREESYNINGNDPMVNNLKVWQRLFPNSYCILITHRRKYLWYLGEDEILKGTISIVGGRLKTKKNK